MSAITIEDLHKSYFNGSHETEVLNGINLSISQNCFVSILGRSGSGKTTLLNVLSTLETITSGQVKINHRPLSKLSHKEIDSVRNSYIGFVFQEFNLVKGMTVLDNVATPLILSGVSYAIAHKKALKALERVGLHQYAKVRPIELSGGQQQRVSIARAVVNNQKIILCDEPTGALDDQTAIEILDLLKEISKEKIVIMVTHDEESAKRYSDRLIMLVDGQIKKDIILSKNLPIAEDEIRKFPKHNMGYKNIFRYSLLSMSVDNTKLKKTFRMLSIVLAVFLLVSVIIENLDVFTEKYMSVFVSGESVDKNTILYFIYQFLEQNITSFVMIILYVILGFCLSSYLFVFIINIINKKKEIAVLKAFGASSKTVSILFALRPVKFTLNIFKKSMIYTFIGILLINGIIDFGSIIRFEYLEFLINFFQVIYGVVVCFLFGIETDYIVFSFYITHVLWLFLFCLVIFMLGSFLPALRISRENTIRTLASE